MLICAYIRNVHNKCEFSIEGRKVTDDVLRRFASLVIEFCSSGSKEIIFVQVAIFDRLCINHPFITHHTHTSHPHTSHPHISHHHTSRPHTSHPMARASICTRVRRACSFFHVFCYSRPSKKKQVSFVYS